MMRGEFRKTIQSAIILLLLLWVRPVHSQNSSTINIGFKRELFVDNHIIEKLDNTRLKLHHPKEAGPMFIMEKPWEGGYSGYSSVFKDGDIYRMYYRARPVDSSTSYTCYAQSRDGINWHRPNLKIVEFAGSKDNNIIMEHSPVSPNFSFFLDTRHGASESERYKAIGRHRVVPGKRLLGLFAYSSSDGIHWKKMQQEAVINYPKFAFDSHNVAFYSEKEKCYVCYFRTWHNHKDSEGQPWPNGVRWISRCTSQDFLHWSDSVKMDCGNTPFEHLYTNATTPYFRAPHIYIALPSRFIDHDDAVSQEAKKSLGLLSKIYLEKGRGFNDMPLMTSRGGNKYDRTFMTTFILPGVGLKNWTTRANYPAFGIVPTPDSNTEMSIYVNKHTGYPSVHLQRYTLRYDGFISVRADDHQGWIVTKPLLFSEQAQKPVQLVINYTTSAIGNIYCEIQDIDGRAIEGFSLAQCDRLLGDEIERVVSWKGSSDLKAIAGRPVRLRFKMKDADLYSVMFRRTD